MGIQAEYLNSPPGGACPGVLAEAAASVPADKRSKPRSPRALLVLYLPALLALALAMLVSVQTGSPISFFTRDPADIANISPFAGAISNLGILFWCATVTVCLLTFLLLRTAEHTSALSWFFLISAVITTLLMLDDLFLLHERVFPDYLHVRQRYVYLFYFMTIALYLVGFRRLILRTEWLLLALALMLFALSLVVDISVKWIEGIVPFYHLFEDGFKLFGIVTWLGYFGRLSLYHLAVNDKRGAVVETSP